MNMTILAIVARQRAKLAYEQLTQYAETIERLIRDETARVLTTETISDIRARSHDPSLEAEEPSDELLNLLDSFPNILRGSLLPYIHGEFERAARSMFNGLKYTSQIVKGANVRQAGLKINEAMPGTLDEAALQRLTDYMHLRHMCAHAAGELSVDLFDRKKVAKAASRIPGAKFYPLLPHGSAPRPGEPRSWAGTVEFGAEFLHAAIVFHAQQVELIANSIKKQELTKNEN